MPRCQDGKERRFNGGDGIVHIKGVVPHEDYKFEVMLDNGSSVTLNMESRLDNIRFGMLVDKELFDRVTTNGNFIWWEDKIEISVREVFQLAQK